MRRLIVFLAFGLVLSTVNSAADPHILEPISRNFVTEFDLSPNGVKNLEQIREFVGAARIVQLGEFTHGDGTAFLARTQIVKFLHERLGFNVLAFESGMHEIEIADGRLADGATVRVENGDPLDSLFRKRSLLPGLALSKRFARRHAGSGEFRIQGAIVVVPDRLP